ncbi:Maf-like protein [Shigella sonnei]|nr:Maf-like protein [Shigella sonnei]
MTSLYLASGSPRRQELLAQLGVTFERIVTGIEEQRQPQESAQQYVVRLAREKAQAGSRKRRRISRCWVRILSLS